MKREGQRKAVTLFLSIPIEFFYPHSFILIIIYSAVLCQGASENGAVS